MSECRSQKSGAVSKTRFLTSDSSSFDSNQYFFPWSSITYSVHHNATALNAGISEIHLQVTGTF